MLKSVLKGLDFYFFGNSLRHEYSRERKDNYENIRVIKSQKKVVKGARVFAGLVREGSCERLKVVKSYLDEFISVYYARLIPPAFLFFTAGYSIGKEDITRNMAHAVLYNELFRTSVMALHGLFFADSDIKRKEGARAVSEMIEEINGGSLEDRAKKDGLYGDHKGNSYSNEFD